MSPEKVDAHEHLSAEVIAAAKRGAELFEIAKNSIVLINTDCGPRIRLERIPTSSNELSHSEWESLAANVNAINDALDTDLVSITPGISTLESKDIKQTFEELAPGYIDWEALEQRKSDPEFEDISPLASLDYQWIPPGPTLTFTKAETDALTVLIEAGATVAIAGMLTSGGLAGPVAGPVALALLVAGLAFVLCRAISKTGRVGIKFTTFPVPTVVPFPV